MHRRETTERIITVHLTIWG